MVLKGAGVQAEVLDALAGSGAATLLVFGEENASDQRVMEAARAATTSVVFSPIDAPLLGWATYGFPTATPYEADGSFVNEFGILQRVRRAVEPPGEVREPWRILLDVGDALDVALPARGAAELFETMASTVPECKGLTWHDIGQHGVDLGRRWTELSASPTGAATSG